jgi:hypothetical protein
MTVPLSHFSCVTLVTWPGEATLLAFLRDYKQHILFMYDITIAHLLRHPKSFLFLGISNQSLGWISHFSCWHYMSHNPHPSFRITPRIIKNLHKLWQFSTHFLQPSDISTYSICSYQSTSVYKYEFSKIWTVVNVQINSVQTNNVTVVLFWCQYILEPWPQSISPSQKVASRCARF